jgi:Type I phosphodiesterase / nucleotide pyrophosphatase
MRTLATALAFLALGAGPALAKQPVASNLDKVLVIGTDGTRWDLLRDAMKDGRAPNLKRLAGEGFGRPSKLEYGPNVLTLSEVGWSSIASGVWPDKHGVDGRKFNMDPKQATKNGYLDFLTRVQRGAPRLDTYLASDWANIGLAENGGPLFGATDDRFAIGVDEETLPAWDAGDVQVTNAAKSFLRKGNPDASFVYFGLVDETAHLSGSATPAYPAAITATDARIGQLLRAVRSRPSYPFESWTIIVTTDHGQRPLDEPSLVSHLSQTPLEITSFLIGAGPGLGAGVKKPKVVDIAPTVLHQLGLPVRRAWKLDGRSLSRAAGSRVSASARKGRLAVSLRLAQPHAGARSIVIQLPAGVKITNPGSVDSHVNGRPVGGSIRGGRRIVVGVPGHRLRSLSLSGAVTVATGHGRTVKLALRGAKPAAGSLAVKLAGS